MPQVDRDIGKSHISLAGRGEKGLNNCYARLMAARATAVEGLIKAIGVERRGDYKGVFTSSWREEQGIIKRYNERLTSQVESGNVDPTEAWFYTRPAYYMPWAGGLIGRVLVVRLQRECGPDVIENDWEELMKGALAAVWSPREGEEADIDPLPVDVEKKIAALYIDGGRGRFDNALVARKIMSDIGFWAQRELKSALVNLPEEKWQKVLPFLKEWADYQDDVMNDRVTDFAWAIAGDVLEVVTEVRKQMRASRR